MKNIKEMIILCAVLAIVFAGGITKVSFAYQEATREDEVKEGLENALIVAAESYALSKNNEFKEKESFIYGSDLIDAGFLVEIDGLDFKNKKIKIVYEEKVKKYQAEIVE